MSSTRYVRAVLVTDGRSARLPAVLAALQDQTLTPQAFHIVALGPVEFPPEAHQAVHITYSDARNYADAVDSVLAEFPANEGEFLWLLHDDTAPAPDVLAKLEATSRKRPRAAVIGGAHVRWDDASRLVNMGVTVSYLGARRVGLVAEDDVNQGQYDAREDVLAVSLGAALVSREAWETLGGLDQGYDSFGDSLDFCRRAWTHGYDVVVVPQALIRHSQEALYDRRGGIGYKRATHTQRRAGEWYHAFAWAPWWALLPLALIVVPSAILRALLRIMQNHPSLVAAELLAPLLLASRAGALRRARSDIAELATHRGAERRLLATPRQVWQHVRDRELGGWERGRAERHPSEFVRREVAAYRARERRLLLVVTLASVGVAAGLLGSMLTAVLRGGMVTGVGIGATDVRLSMLWERAWSGWSDVGLGIPALDGALAAMWLPLALLGSDLRLGVGLLLALGPVIAVLSAWRAAGVVTRGLAVRAAVSLIYGLWPMFLASVFDARLGAVVVHIALPWVAWGLARAAGWRKGVVLGDGNEYAVRRVPSANAGLLAALALTAVTTAAPALLVPSLLVIVLTGGMAGRLRWRVWTVGLLPLVVGLPGIVTALTQPSQARAVLMREVGPSSPFEPLNPLQLLAGHGGSNRWFDAFAGWDWLGYLLGALVLAAGLWAGISQARSRRVWAALGVAGLGFAVASLTQGGIAAWPDLAGNPAVRGWPGAGMSLALLGLLGAVAIAYGALPAHKAGKVQSAAVIARVTVGVSLVALAAPVVFMAWPGAPRGTAEVASAAVLPLAVPLEVDGAARQRVLVIQGGAADTVRFSVLNFDGSEFLTGRAVVGSDGQPVAREAGGYPSVDIFSPVVAQLAAGGDADPALLADWAVGMIVVTRQSDHIRASLDANPALTLVGGSERGTVYRVERSASVERVSRAWLATTSGLITVPSAYASGELALPGTTGGVLVLAVPADSAWRASLNGKPLAATPDELGRQAFAVPSGGGTLSYEFRDDSHRWWWWASAVATAWALLGAIPMGARGLRERAT